MNFVCYKGVYITYYFRSVESKMVLTWLVLEERQFSKIGFVSLLTSLVQD